MWSDDVSALEARVQVSLVKLKTWNDKVLRNDLEFDLNDLNIALAINESAIDDRKELLDLEMVSKFLKERSSHKSDSKTHTVVKNIFRLEILALEHDRWLLKKFNRIHKWFIRLADHLMWRVIQENVDAKRWSF